MRHEIEQLSGTVHWVCLSLKVRLLVSNSMPRTPPLVSFFFCSFERTRVCHSLYQTVGKQHSGQCLSIYTHELHVCFRRWQKWCSVVLDSGEVHSIGWVGTFVPCVHLCGSHAFLVSIHLREGGVGVTRRHLESKKKICPLYCSLKWLAILVMQQFDLILPFHWTSAK